MSHQDQSTRIRSICQMLLEIAAGNFDFRIAPSVIDDEVEELSVLVNMFAEQLRSNVFRNGYINSHFAYQFLVQNTFVLDYNFSIKNYNLSTAKSLELTTDTLYGTAFESYLTPNSLQLWRKITADILLDSNYHQTYQLTYVSKNEFVLPFFCTISRLFFSDKILISSISIVLHNYADSNSVILNNNYDQKPPKRNNSHLIEKLYNFILQNLDSPLPTLKELAKKFATNEFHLKAGFKDLFKTSIYHFYNEERLKRAHLLIQQTNLPLKTIADMCGFNIYSTFSKSFKKKFSYSPNRLKRNNLDL